MRRLVARTLLLFDIIIQYPAVAKALLMVPGFPVARTWLQRCQRDLYDIVYAILLLHARHHSRPVTWFEFAAF